ncbi:myoD family inhibitor domain-containing protein 2 [Erythrolamprus reginae]|uniref:myoD family inhibitor domain-containing protein 2 n=1 Tax=Erythrolamprus reginae TaxID=121349 RepID=UPI00396CFE23
MSNTAELFADIFIPPPPILQMSETETDIGKVRTQSFENDQRTTSLLLKEEHQLANKDDKSMKSIVLSSVSEFSITDVPSKDTRSDRKLSDSTTSSLSSLQICETQFSYLEDAASGHERNNNDECATLILACLFCQFWEFLFMLPDVCENWMIDTCCPSHRYHQTSSDTSNNGDCSCNCDIDCSILETCQESGECLELALEISQVCFH